MRNPKVRWALLALVGAVYIAGGLSRISFDVDILKLLPTHLPQVRGLGIFIEQFAQMDELVITLEGPGDLAAEADSLAEDLGRHTGEVSIALSRPPWESDPAGLSELLAFQLINIPPVDFRAILDRLAPSQTNATLQESLDELAESFDPAVVAMRGYDPFRLTESLKLDNLPSGADEFSSADGTFRVVYVKSAKPLANYREAIAWIASIRSIVNEWRGDRDVTIGFTGEPAFVADISGSMQHTMALSGGATMLIIAGIFWLCYRRLGPLLVLQGMLALTFLLSLATAGWFLDDLTVIGVGFASVMIGLSVDYGFFVFQQSMRHQGTTGALRRRCLLSIAWTCSTTAAAFLALNFSSLPGLTQLGNLVALGVLTGAGVMLGIFAPLALRMHQRHPMPLPLPVEAVTGSPRFLRIGLIVTCVGIATFVTTLFVKGPPQPDFSARTLRPRVSEAYSTMDRLYARMSDDRGLLSLVVTGHTPDEVRQRLLAAEERLQALKAEGVVAEYHTALPLWPNGDNQRENLAAAVAWLDQLDRLRKAAFDAGFTAPSMELTAAIFAQWRAWSGMETPIWPENTASKWILRRLACRSDSGCFASGIAYPVTDRESELLDASLGEGIYLVSWELLGRQLQKVVPGEMLKVIVALAALVIGILAFGFRSWRAVIVFVSTIILILACLAGAMSLFDIPVSFFNLAAVLLLLGTGTDYSILLLLAIRRHSGDANFAQRELGIVISLCCLSAVAGFGSIVGANHVGLSQLGLTCAIGLFISGCISLFVVPPVYGALTRFSGRP